MKFLSVFIIKIKKDGYCVKWKQKKKQNKQNKILYECNLSTIRKQHIALNHYYTLLNQR